jgi:hypothetical protein
MGTPMVKQKKKEKKESSFFLLENGNLYSLSPVPFAFPLWNAGFV